MGEVGEITDDGAPAQTAWSVNVPMPGPSNTLTDAETHAVVSQAPASLTK